MIVTITFISIYFLLLLFSQPELLLWTAPILLVAMLAHSYYTIILAKTPLRKEQTLTALVTLLAVGSIWLLTPLSQSIPLSIGRAAQLTLFGLVLATGLTTPFWPRTRLKSVSQWLVIGHSLLWPYSLLLKSMPGLAQWIPDAGLFTFMVGQSHAYIIYLVSLPVALWHATRRGAPRWWWLVTGLLLLGVVTSFSRIGLVLLVAELLVLIRVLRPQLSATGRRVVQGITWGLIGIGLSWLVFTSVAQLSYGSHCRLPVLQPQLCKYFAANARLDYLRQAAVSIQQHPWLGSGGHTFSFTSYREQRTPDQYSFYPHNDYVQLVVEYGLVGVAILVLLGFWLWQLGKKWSTAPLFSRVLLVGVAVAALDGWTNYNWNFHGVLFLLATWLVLASQSLEKMPAVPAPGWWRWPLLLLFLLVSLPLGWLSTRFIWAEVVAAQSPAQYLQLYPYQVARAEAAITHNQLPPAQVATLRQLYHAHYAIHLAVANSSLDPAVQYQALTQVVQLNPLQTSARVKLVMQAMKEQQPEQLRDQLRWLVAYLPTTERHTVASYEREYLQRVLIYANQLAPVQPQLAAEITATAYQFEPWRVNDVQSLILQQPDEYPPKVVLTIIESLAPIKLFSYGQPLSDWLINQLTDTIRSERPMDTRRYLQATLIHTDWAPEAVLGRMTDAYAEVLVSLPNQTPLERARRQNLIFSWQESLATLTNFGKVGSKVQESQAVLDALTR